MAMIAGPALAATTTVSVTFTNGFIGEYDNGAQQPEHAILFSALNIRSVVVSQTTDNGQFGGSQGNDFTVNLTMNYTNGSSVTCASAVNWLDKSPGNFVEGIGVTVDTCNDGYTLSANRSKTYLLRTAASTRIYRASAVGVQATYATASGSSPVAGSADTRGALGALNAELGTVPATITGPSGGAGAATSQISVNENQTAVTQMVASEPVTWSITGGTDATLFDIATDGTITFKAAPDFEAPADSDRNNSYVITVSARDGNGNTTTQTVTIRVLDLTEGGTDTTAPTVTGPSGGAGAVVSEISVNEKQFGVTQMTASEAVAWSISGGVDAAKFSIATDGTITFIAAPDFEAPTDDGTNNTYILTVLATDGNGNTATQTVTVTVLDLDDTAPIITGPSGGAGAANSALSVNENQTGVTRVTANETVTWSITGGSEAAKFDIAADGTVTFVAAPDFENPTDVGANNTYILTVTATDADGNAATQTITVTVLNLDDTAPIITGPSGGAGTANEALTVNEGQTAVAKLTASEGVTWAITSGDDNGKFQIAADGTITFRAAPDFENPTDGGTNNTYILTVTATDGNRNTSTQTITVTVLNLDDTAPIITGPSGGAGAENSALSVNENQTGVTRVTANETVTWSITGGSEAAKFDIAADGTITFVAAPDFETPTDAETNNTYILVVTATDEIGNSASQTVTVTVLNVDDTGPAITGPSGGAGAASSAITINEGLAAVTTFASNEPVTWAIVGGDDAAGFSIDPATGALSFITTTDFENPTDTDKNNTYIVGIRAVDAAGNVSFQTLTVTVVNVHEIARKIAEIGGRLRSGLRRYAMHSLGDMLSFNEDLIQQADDGDGNCASNSEKKALSGALNANESSQQARLGYAKQVSQCGRPYRVMVNAGLSMSRFDGDLTTRALGSVRVERKLGSDVTLGLGVMASTANDALASFEDSRVSDTSLQVNFYGRARLSERLRAGAFAGYGKAWYTFSLNDGGLQLDGKMTGNRHIYGAMFSGDVIVKGVVLTTDAILSRAVERLGSANLSAAYLGEKHSDIGFAVGNVDTTRLSIPVTGQLVLWDAQQGNGRVTKLLLSPGLLCEDTSVDASSMQCGYQMGAKLNSRLSTRGSAYVDYKFESVDGLRRNLIGVGYAHTFGSSNPVEVGLDLNRGMAGMVRADNRAMVRLRLMQ